MRRTRVLAALALAALLVAAACSGGSDGTSTTGDTAPAADISISAAASVLDGVKLVVDAYEADHPDLVIAVTDEDQAPMVSAVENGTPDVAIFPTPWLTDPSVAPDPIPFATNNAVIVVAKGNPKDVAGLDAFAAGTDLRTQVCGTPTPIGTFILAVMRSAGVTPADDTVDKGCEGDAAKAVAAGDLDAAAMYRFGFIVPDGAELIQVDPKVNVPIEVGTYVLSDGDEVQAFVDYLTSDAVRETLAENGFVAS